MHRRWAAAVMGEKVRRQTPRRCGSDRLELAALAGLLSPCRETSRWKKQARSGEIRRLGSAWRSAAGAYWSTPQRWNRLETRMVSRHAAEVASGACR